MESIFDEDSWRKFLRGFTIYDCAIIRSKGFGFILVEEEHDNRDPDEGLRTRFLTMAIDHPIDERFGSYVSSDYSYTTLASSAQPPEYVAVDIRTNVFSKNPQRMGNETPIDQLIDMHTARGSVGIIQRVVRVNGQIYALGDYRKIYRRLGGDQWMELASEGKGAPMPKDADTKAYTVYDIGFKDMDAFAEDDMYAVGGSGDVWRFDGNKWHQCPFPTNEVLETVCCGKDGNVYISDMRGAIWVGREDRWKKLTEGGFAWGFQPVDSAWFQDRLYLGCQEGLWMFDPDAKDLLPVGETAPIAPNSMNCGRVDISPDGKTMLTAGPHGAYLKDDDGWHRLFCTFDFI